MVSILGPDPAQGLFLVYSFIATLMKCIKRMPPAVQMQGWPNTEMPAAFPGNYFSPGQVRKKYQNLHSFCFILK